MANRLYNQFRLQLEKAVVDLFGHVTIGAAGAPTLVTGGTGGSSKGIASISRLSAGRYSIVLQDTYYGLLMFQAMLISTAAPAAPEVRIVSEAVSNSASKAIIIQFAVGGVATDPASGEAFRFVAQLKQSSAY
jgi:hypothetical protein